MASVDHSYLGEVEAEPGDQRQAEKDIENRAEAGQDVDKGRGKVVSEGRQRSLGLRLRIDEGSNHRVKQQRPQGPGGGAPHAGCPAG